MPIQKITGPEGSEMTGFVIVDLDGATAADGVVRCAKKILMDGARTMARSRSYSWALLEQQRSGASAAINVAPPGRAAGVAAFVDAVLPRVQAGELSLDPGKGVGSDDLAALRDADARNPVRNETLDGAALRDVLCAAGAVTAAATVLDGLDGATVAIEGAGALGPVLVAQLAAAGARVVSVGTGSGTLTDLAGLDPTALAADWTRHGEALPTEAGSSAEPAEVLAVPADVLFCGSKLGLVDHHVAAALRARVLAPIGPAPLTAKGLAIATRSDVTALPDFLTLSGSLHADVAPDAAGAETLLGQVRSRTEELTRDALSHDEGPYLGACARAERFLGSWQDELPFGRPLA